MTSRACEKLYCIRTHRYIWINREEQREKTKKKTTVKRIKKCFQQLLSLFFFVRFSGIKFSCYNAQWKKNTLFAQILCLYFYCDTKFDYGFLGYTFGHLWKSGGIYIIYICACVGVFIDIFAHLSGISGLNLWPFFGRHMLENDELVNVIKRSLWYHLISLVLHTVLIYISYR